MIIDQLSIINCVKVRIEIDKMKEVSKNYNPPKPARWILKHIIDRDISYSAMGDFYEIYAAKVKEFSPLRAGLWYWMQALYYSLWFHYRESIL